jgi:CDP-paratose 2-epimerase
MKRVIVTGSLGLIGQSCSMRFIEHGWEVVGIDNDYRKEFFGEEASVRGQLHNLSTFDNYTHLWEDIRGEGLGSTFEGADLVIHCAAQPSHDWAYKNPRLDFSINAEGTLNLLELTKKHSPNAMFVYLSTNKVYGDGPNRLDLVEEETRYSCKDKSYAISENFPVDQCTHSIFGVSKLSADLLVQEYGRNLGMRTAVLRCGCLTGKNHQGAELHGFLSYLSKCVQEEKPYVVYGYKGKQVRDNIHAEDVASCIHRIYEDEKCFGEVFNIGGSFDSNISMLEAIDYFEKAYGKKLTYRIIDDNRTGDHIWYVTDMTKFKTRYPDWVMKYPLDKLMKSFSDTNEFVKGN